MIPQNLRQPIRLLLTMMTTTTTTTTTTTLVRVYHIGTFCLVYLKSKDSAKCIPSGGKRLLVPLLENLKSGSGGLMKAFGILIG